MPRAGSGSGDLATQQQAILLLLVLIQTLLPQESLREEQNNQDDLDALTKLTKSSSLSSKLEVSSQSEDSFANIASLAWGVMLSTHGPPNFRSESSTAQHFHQHENHRERKIYGEEIAEGRDGSHTYGRERQRNRGSDTGREVNSLEIFKVLHSSFASNYLKHPTLSSISKQISSKSAPISLQPAAQL